MGQAAVMHSHVACAARHRAPACRWAGRRRRQGPQHGGVMHGGGAATRGMQGRWAACKGGPGRRRLHLRVPTPGSARTMCLLRRRLPAQHAQIGRRLLLLGLGSSGAAGARPAAPLVLQAVHQTAGGSGDQLGSPWRQPVRRWGRPARRPHGAANKEPRLLSQGCDCGAALAAGTRCVARAWERRRSAGSAAQGAGARPARARHQPERTPPPCKHHHAERQAIRQAGCRRWRRSACTRMLHADVCGARTWQAGAQAAPRPQPCPAGLQDGSAGRGCLDGE